MGSRGRAKREEEEEEATEKETETARGTGRGGRGKKGERRSCNAIIQLRAHIVLTEESEGD